jgi:uncharacterized peroxidase-related enzyme
MSYLQLPAKETSEPRVAKLLEEAEARWGFIPNIVKAYALAPEILEAEDAWSHGVMKVGFLPRRLKEAIATIVSRTNGCRYCATAHSYAYKIAGGTQAHASSILNEGEAKLPESEQAALRFAERATRDPKSIRRSDVEELQKYYSDGEIVELCTVIQQFMGYNWFVTILGLEVEPENPGRTWLRIEL